MPFNCPELVRASQPGELDAVRWLVESGAYVNSRDQHGSGPLLCFHPQVLEYLLANGAAPNQQTNENGDTVLLGLVHLNLLACVRLLLAAGADPHALVRGTGENALHGALL
jgi:uncharacterized protein